MSACAFSPAGSRIVVELGLGRLRRLDDLFAVGRELEAIVDRAVQRRQLAVHVGDQLLQPVDRDPIGLGAGDVVEPLGNAVLPRLQRRHFLLPRRLRLRRQQRRRRAGQRLRIGLQPERLDDLRNVAAGDAVEEIAHLREHQPSRRAGDHGGSRYRRKGEEQLGLDSERFFHGPIPQFLSAACLVVWRDRESGLFRGNLVLLDQLFGALVEALAVDAELGHVGFPFLDRGRGDPQQLGALLVVEGERDQPRIALHLLLADGFLRLADRGRSPSPGWSRAFR